MARWLSGDRDRLAACAVVAWKQAGVDERGLNGFCSGLASLERIAGGLKASYLEIQARDDLLRRQVRVEVGVTFHCGIEVPFEESRQVEEACCAQP